MINTLRILGASGVLKRFLLAAALMGSGLLISACGQKGPLYMAAPQGAAPGPMSGDPATKPPQVK